MANPTDDDRALARSYMSWPDMADRLAHTFAVIREEGQQASAAALAAEVERRRAAEGLAERMWPYVEAAARVGAICGDPDQTPGYGDVQMIAVFTVAQCRAAAALVREREERETKP